MTNSIELINETAYVFKNAELTEKANIIREATNNINLNAMIIGEQFAYIKEHELWKEDNYKNFEQFALAIGYAKSTAYKLIYGYEISTKYELKGWTNTQCQELKALEKAKGKEGVEKALKDGIIKVGMSAKSIRDKVKELTEKPAEKSADEKPADEKPAETTPATPKVEITPADVLLNIECKMIGKRKSYTVNGKAVAVSKVPAIEEHMNKILEIMNS